VWTVRLVVRVPPDKRHEFVQSAHELMRDERSHLQRVLLLQDRQEANIFCWMGDGSGTQELKAFVNSKGFRAFQGAAEVLGGVEDLCVLHDTPRGTEH
jgi:hypothetical protein